MPRAKRKTRGSFLSIAAPRPEPEPDQQAKANGHLVEQLATSAIYASGHLTRSPHFLLAMLEAEAWKHFADPHTRQLYEYDDIDVFARARIPAGLQIPDGVAGLIRICQNIPGEDADKSLRILRGLIPEAPPHEKTKGGRGKKTDSNATGLDRGQTYLIRRLKRDLPELASRVISGELSAHAAAVEAGIRQRMVQVPTTPDGFIRAIRKYLTEQERAVVKKEL